MNHSFLEWSNLRESTEPSDPKAGDLIITNPKSFINKVMARNGKLKNDGKAQLSSFSRFKLKGEDKDGLVSGVVQHHRYSGGIRKKFDPAHTLDVTDAFDVSDQRIFLHVSPTGRSSEYIKNAYPIWKFQMSNGEIPWQKSTAPEPELELDPEMPVEPHIEPETPDVIGTSTEPQYMMQGRNIVPREPEPSFTEPVAQEPNFTVPEPADIPFLEPMDIEPVAELEQLADWYNPWKRHKDNKSYQYFD